MEKFFFIQTRDLHRLTVLFIQNDFPFDFLFGCAVSSFFVKQEENPDLFFYYIEVEIIYTNFTETGKRNYSKKGSKKVRK